MACALDILQGEKNTYYGYLIPCIATLWHKYERLKTENFSLVKPILNACIEGLEKRFLHFLTLDDEANDAIIAAFTIPRFKLKWFHVLKDKATKSVDDWKKLLAKTAKEISEREEQPIDPPTAQENSKTRIEDFFFDFNITSTSLQKTQIQENDIDLEILHYMNDSKVELDAVESFPIIKKKILLNIILLCLQVVRLKDCFLLPLL